MLEHAIRIDMLGGLRVRARNEVITRFRTQKAAELLAYLALYQDRIHARDAVIELLWPESDIDSGRVRLRQELASLRRQLEPAGVRDGQVLLATRATIQLNARAIETDVAQFRGLLKEAQGTTEPRSRASRLESAVGLYSGELLTGHFADWVIVERERLERERGILLRDLTTALQAAGDLEGALRAAHRAAEADPFDEDVRRTLLELLIRLGRRSEALKEYGQLRRVLREVLDLEPAPETRALVEGLPLHGELAVDTRLGRNAWKQQQVGAVLTPAPADPHPMHVRAPCRLPLPLSRFFGREEELQRLQQLLSPLQKSADLRPSTRLVTLTGTGGAGKTRLAIAAAELLCRAYSGAVHFVALAQVEHGDGILPAILKSLDRPVRADADLTEQTATALASGPGLLVLDNFEHLVAQGARVVAELLVGTPELRALVTSRHPLRVEGEVELPVPPLPVPSSDAGAEVEALGPSVQLFVDRVRSVRPDFGLRDANLEAVISICRALEGLPLSLELAAGWGKAMTPAEMLCRLQRPGERLDLLVNRKRHTTHRHRSLRAALDSSYTLLPPDEREMFSQLSIFRGGWTAEAAREICAWRGASSRQADVLAVLLALAESSLIVSDESDGGTRFNMLETVREYAAEQMPAARAEQLAGQHSRYYVELAEEAARSWHSPNESASLRRLDADYANLETALTWASARDAALLQRLVAALARYWTVRGLTREGIAWCRAGLEHDATDEAVRVRALVGAARLALGIPDAEMAEQWYTEALARAEAVGDEQSVADATGGLALVAFVRSDHTRALALHEQAYAARVRLDDRNGIIRSLFSIAVAHQSLGSLPLARARFAESLFQAREAGDLGSIGLALNGLGFIDRCCGRLTEATAYLREAVGVHEHLGNLPGLADAVHNLAVVAYEQGDYDEAEALGCRSAAMFRSAGNEQMSAIVLSIPATTAMYKGDLDRAKQLWAQLLAQGERMRDAAVQRIAHQGLARTALYAGHPRESLESIARGEAIEPEKAFLGRAYWSVERGVALLLAGDATAARKELLYGLRGLRPLGCGIHLVRLQEALADVDLLGHRQAAAARRLAAAETLREQMGLAPPPVERAARDQRRQVLNRGDARSTGR